MLFDSLSSNRKHPLWQRIMVGAATKSIIDKARAIVQKSQDAVVAEKLLKECSSIVNKFSTSALSKSDSGDITIDVLIGKEGAEVLRSISLKLTEYMSKGPSGEASIAWFDSLFEPLKKFQSAVKHVDECVLPQPWVAAMKDDWHKLQLTTFEGLVAKHDTLVACNESCKGLAEKLQAFAKECVTLRARTWVV